MVSAGTMSSLTSSTRALPPVLTSNSSSSPLAVITYGQPLSTVSSRVISCRISSVRPYREIRLRSWRISAIPEDSVPLEANPVENTQEIVASGNGDAIIIQTLLILAFIGLSILTIGVIYIAVTDFLQKREKEKFEKDEAAVKKGKKSDKKRKATMRAGPRGFGQVKKEEEDFDD